MLYIYIVFNTIKDIQNEIFIITYIMYHTDVNLQCDLYRYFIRILFSTALKEYLNTDLFFGIHSFLRLKKTNFKT